MKILLVDDLDIGAGIKLAQFFYFFIFCSHVFLIHRRQLDICFKFGQIKIRAESRGHIAGSVPFYGKSFRLIDPIDMIHIKQFYKLDLRLVFQQRNI